MFLPLFANPEYIINLTLLSSALTSERKGEISLDFPASSARVKVCFVMQKSGQQSGKGSNKREKDRPSVCGETEVDRATKELRGVQ